MAIQYIGLSAINGPLVFLEGVSGVGYEEVVELRLKNGQVRNGRVIAIDGDKVAIQVFEGTHEISLDEVRAEFLGKPLELALSKEMLGRIFDGAGRPIDGLSPVFASLKRDVNGEPLNPVMRVYPRNYIQTGISSIDVLTTLIRGQKLPIFTGTGLPHNELAVQIVRQAKITGTSDSDEKFCIVFAAMGVKHDVAHYFQQTFSDARVMDRVVMFTNLANDPIIERLLTPRAALTAAEYLAYELDYNVLVVLTDMTAYCEALREFSSSMGEIPARKGYPGYLYSDLSSLYERAGMAIGKKGSVTQIPILTMPNDDITHPVPDLTGYITEGQIVLDRELYQKGIFPPISILPSLSRLMKDGIGAKYTREDHQSLANQLFASYAKVQDIRSLASVIGEDELNENDQVFILFGNLFEQNFLNQRDQNRDVPFSLDLGWDLLSILPKNELTNVSDQLIEKYYNPDRAFQRFNLKASTLVNKIIAKGK
ncbi:MAG TPA: V-type ATP synthase subunit B [Bacilli bacterium]|nr:V-type ATP synthase subunit B [Bacilli bacterium]HPS18763.1 V-type ATP synthase subunit B [Bacilli bacterium]